ncbi:transposable element Tcb1 transposase [Trichonephila clavipes]|nr:transposable element Tcb1 transposase [Trichonephila clavipes]
MEAGWSGRRVARQLGHSDCVVRRCWDQWIRGMSFIRRRGSGRPRQTSRREDRHIVRNACVQPAALSAAIQAQVAPSLGASHLGSRHPLRVLPLRPTYRPVWSDAAYEETGLQRNGTRSSLATRERIQIQSQQ